MKHPTATELLAYLLHTHCCTNQAPLPLLLLLLCPFSIQAAQPITILVSDPSFCHHPGARVWVRLTTTCIRYVSSFGQSSKGVKECVCVAQVEAPAMLVGAPCATTSWGASGSCCPCESVCVTQVEAPAMLVGGTLRHYQLGGLKFLLSL